MIFNLVNDVFNLYSLLLIVYILMSWFPYPVSMEIRRALAPLAEPYLGVFRSLFQRLFPATPVDFSPIVAFFVLRIVENIVMNLLVQMTF